jgi:hypothetical protein
VAKSVTRSYTTFATDDSGGFSGAEPASGVCVPFRGGFEVERGTIDLVKSLHFLKCSVTITDGFSRFSWDLESLKGMQKHCIIEHFFRFVKQIRRKPSVIVTLHSQARAESRRHADLQSDQENQR